MRLITASDLMNPEVLTVPEDMSVADLAAFLTDNEITGAPVVGEDGQLTGVVSVVDIAALASEELDDEEENGASNGCSPYYEAGWNGELKEGDVGSLTEDLDDDEEYTVADIMTPELYAVGEDATVSEVARMMLEKHLHRVLVTRDGKAVGIISTSDLLGLLVDEE